MNRLRQWVRQLLKRIAAWVLLKVAVSGIDEADGVKLGQDIRVRVTAKLGDAQAKPLLKSVKGYLSEIGNGLGA